MVEILEIDKVNRPSIYTHIFFSTALCRRYRPGLLITTHTFTPAKTIKTNKHKIRACGGAVSRIVAWSCPSTSPCGHCCGSTSCWFCNTTQHAYLPCHLQALRRSRKPTSLQGCQLFGERGSALRLFGAASALSFFLGAGPSGCVRSQTLELRNSRLPYSNQL